MSRRITQKGVTGRINCVQNLEPLEKEKQLLVRLRAKDDSPSQRNVLRGIFILTAMSRMWHGCRPVEKNGRRQRK
jgi:hypothetical protein